MRAIARRVVNQGSPSKKKKPSAEEPLSRDTWPAPPPQSAMMPIAPIPHAVQGSAHDTIRTPPPDAHEEIEEPIIPTLRGVDVERAFKKP